MITKIVKVVNGSSDGNNTFPIYDIRLNSSDEKPTEKITNGSTCIEVDTGSMFIYDAESEQWNEI